MWMWTWVGCIWHTFSSLPIWRSTDNHTWHHLKRHVCFHSRKWACCMERTMVHPYVKNFIMSWSLHDLKGLVFVADVVATNLTQEMVVSSVISWLIGAVMKLGAIAKIRKYRMFHEGHHFIRWPWRCMAHPGMIWIVSLGSVPIFSTINKRKVICPCLLAFNFSCSMLILLFSLLWPLL
jgi:hypothetical protein